MTEPGKSEVLKCIQAASAISTLCTSWEALRWSINALRARLDTYDLEVWSILREREMYVALVKELEEVLAAEESTDKEVEMREEKVCYDVKRVVTARQEVMEDKDGSKGEDESELDEEEDEPVRGPVLSAQAQGKHPAK